MIAGDCCAYTATGVSPAADSTGRSWLCAVQTAALKQYDAELRAFGGLADDEAPGNGVLGPLAAISEALRLGRSGGRWHGLPGLVLSIVCTRHHRIGALQSPHANGTAVDLRELRTDLRTRCGTPVLIHHVRGCETKRGDGHDREDRDMSDTPDGMIDIRDLDADQLRSVSPARAGSEPRACG